MRDYLDVAALADSMGIDRAAGVLADVDRFYADRSGKDKSVVSALVTKLAHPEPRDRSALADLPHYKGLVTRWQKWGEVARVCADIAEAILRNKERRLT